MLTGMGALPKDIENVVWLQTSFIGDIILTTAAMQLLRKKAPAVRQYLITTPVGFAALKDQPFVHEILIWEKRKESLLKSGKRLRNSLLERGITAQNTVLLQVHKSIRSSLLRRLIDLPTVTYEETLLNGNSFRVPRVAVFHEAARVAMLLQPLGFTRHDILNARPKLELAKPVQDKLQARIEELKSYSHIVGIAPGSVWATKRWPASSYAQLVVELLKKPDIAIVLLGAGPEKQQAQEISAAVSSGSERLFDFVGQTTLEDLPAIYSMLHLLVSNDSSPIHYASALNIPTLAIFGATVPAMGFYPLADNSHVEEVDLAELPCRPCSDHGPKVCPLKHFRCMNDIPAHHLVRQTLEMLAVFPANAPN